EVLEEGDVEIAPARSANVERWLRRTRIPEARNRQHRKVVSLASHIRSTNLWIAKIDQSDCTKTRARIRTIERIGAIPGERLSRLRNCAGEFQANRYTAVNRRDTGYLPTVENSIGNRVGHFAACKFRHAPVVREIEHVSSIEGQHTPASISRVDRIRPRS